MKVILKSFLNKSQYSSELFTKGKGSQEESYNFVDPFFKPDQESLFDSKMGRHALAEKWESFVWKRPSEVYGDEHYSLFHGIKPDDIKQGY